MMRSIAIRDFRDVSKPAACHVFQVRFQKSLSRLFASGIAMAPHAKPSLHEWPHQPGPDGALVIR